MKKLLLLLPILFLFNCKKTEDKSTERLSISETFRYQKGDRPIISVHRGGKGISGYPENCLETIQHINSKIPAIYEVDVASTKDNVLVLMHDDNLERTTTGQGKIKGYTFQELQRLYLVDDYGVATVYKIPKFRDVLLWARDNNVVFTVDIKRSVNVADVIKVVEELEAENISIIITYDLKQAQKAYKINPDLMLSVTARNLKELDWLIHSNIPTENMIAFTGTRMSSSELYSKIHSYGIKTILGTLGNLDRQAKARGDKLYGEWVGKGIDIVATDRPLAVAKALKISK